MHLIVLTLLLTPLGDCSDEIERPQMLTIPHCKESLSRAYITAVVGRSRLAIDWGREYDYGVDGTVKHLSKYNNRIYEDGFGFDFQAKSSVDWEIEGNEIVYDLRAENFNDLALRSANSPLPLYLILLCLSKKPTSWLKVQNAHLILKDCAFFHRITEGPTDNTATKRIRIPVRNIFRPANVRKIMGAVVRGGNLP